MLKFDYPNLKKKQKKKTMARRDIRKLAVMNKLLKAVSMQQKFYFNTCNRGLCQLAGVDHSP